VFDHVTIRASDRDASERFYATVLAAIDVRQSASDGDEARWQEFAIATAADGSAVTRRLHIGFAAASRAKVDAFWRAGIDAGYRDDGAPGPRPQYTPDYYGAFLLDPDGNSAEAVHHGELRGGGAIDHLWIRVADVRAAAAFYETIAPRAGLRVAEACEDYARCEGAGASFSLVPGEPTQNLQMAFPTRGGAAAMRDPDGNAIELVPAEAPRDGAAG
jgi:catechol 2,3-dioxygenase-like lactoylglutathione lyase family enzyme